MRLGMGVGVGGPAVLHRRGSPVLPVAFVGMTSGGAGAVVSPHANTAPGDMMVAFLSRNASTGSITTVPAGWSSKASHTADLGSEITHVRTVYRQFLGDGSDTLAVPSTAGQGGVLLVYRNAATPGLINTRTLAPGPGCPTNLLVSSLSGLPGSATSWVAFIICCSKADAAFSGTPTGITTRTKNARRAVGDSGLAVDAWPQRSWLYSCGIGSASSFSVSVEIPMMAA